MQRVVPISSRGSVVLLEAQRLGSRTARTTRLRGSNALRLAVLLEDLLLGNSAVVKTTTAAVVDMAVTVREATVVVAEATTLLRGSAVAAIASRVAVVVVDPHHGRCRSRRRWAMEALPARTSTRLPRRRHRLVASLLLLPRQATTSLLRLPRRRSSGLERSGMTNQSW